jgi:putative membrane protein (TIGR04086 family)
VNQPDALDLTAIGRGAGVALLVAVPAAVVQTVAAPGALKSLALLVTLVGFGLGGHVAGAPHPDRALTHGGLAGLAAGVVVLVVGIARRSAAGEPVAWPSQPFLALLALSSGVIGGYVAFRRAAAEPAEPADEANGEDVRP